jgi:DNA-binding Lrp family transcriptional regulator
MRKLKDIDFQILSELMKNSKISDRELARRLAVSQPTVTRRRARLESEGLIQEYTLIPDFTKLGYHLMAITLFKYGQEASEQIRQGARQTAMKVVRESPAEMVMAERGTGLGYDGVTISFHKDYRSYVQYKNWVRENNPVKTVSVESFIVNLDDSIHYKSLTFSTLAKHLLKGKRKETRAQ